MKIFHPNSSERKALKEAKNELLDQPPQLFKKRMPNLKATAFPFKFLVYWFTRRFNVFPKRWNDASEPVAKLLIVNLIYGEGPRFRLQEQALYFTDMLNRQVLKYSLETEESSVVYQDPSDYLSGLGFLPDGRLLISSMNNRVVLVHNEAAGTTETYADVSHVTQVRANDMVVDSSGRAYLGNFGFSLANAMQMVSTTLVSIDTDRSVHVEDANLIFPNGCVITPDGKTLIVAETFEARLTAFDIVEDGRLENRRVWAKIGAPADGICLDAEGCVWVSVPQVGLYNTCGGLVRVREGGEIVHMFGFGRNGIIRSVFACQLGSDTHGRHHLFFMEATTCRESIIFKEGKQHDPKGNGALKSIEVSVGPARMASNVNYCGGYC